MNIDIQSILKSPIFNKLLKQSKFVLGKKGRILSVVAQLLSKVNRHKSIATLGTEAIGKFKLLASLVYHFAKGNYITIQTQSILIVVGVILYFISPIDLIPDFLPAVGYLDDLTLMAWLFSTIGSELDTFESWKKQYTKAETIDYLDLKH